MPRAAVLVALGLLALAGCGAEGPEDPAALTPGAGIPMGAIGAAGVSYDGAGARGDTSVVKGKIKPRGSKASPPAPLPSAPDPFAEPPTPEEATPRLGPRHPHPSSSKETTL